MDPTWNNIGSNQLLQTLSWLNRIAYYDGFVSSASVFQACVLLSICPWYSLIVRFIILASISKYYGSGLVQHPCKNIFCIKKHCLGQNENFVRLSWFEWVHAPRWSDHHLKIFWKKLFWVPPTLASRNWNRPKIILNIILGPLYFFWLRPCPPQNMFFQIFFWVGASVS